MPTPQRRVKCQPRRMIRPSLSSLSPIAPCMSLPRPPYACVRVCGQAGGRACVGTRNRGRCPPREADQDRVKEGAGRGRRRKRGADWCFHAGRCRISAGGSGSHAAADQSGTAAPGTTMAAPPDTSTRMRREGVWRRCQTSHNGVVDVVVSHGAKSTNACGWELAGVPAGDAKRGKPTHA